jgi:putative transposase
VSVERRREVVDRQNPSLSIVRPCRLLAINRSGLYYQPRGISKEDLALMKLIDRQYLVTPFYGARKITAWLKGKQYSVNRKRINQESPWSSWKFTARAGTTVDMACL